MTIFGSQDLIPFSGRSDKTFLKKLLSTKNMILNKYHEQTQRKIYQRSDTSDDSKSLKTKQTVADRAKRNLPHYPWRPSADCAMNTRPHDSDVHLGVDFLDLQMIHGKSRFGGPLDFGGLPRKILQQSHLVPPNHPGFDHDWNNHGDLRITRILTPQIIPKQTHRAWSRRSDLRPTWTLGCEGSSGNQKKNGNWGNPPVSWRWFSKRNHLEMIFRLIFHQFNKRCSQIFPWVGGSCHLRTGMAQYGEKKPESGTNPITRVKTTCNTWDDPPSSDSSYHLVTSFPLFIEIFLHVSMFYWKCSSISHPFPHVLLGFLQIFLCFTGISHQFSQTFPCVSIKTLRFPSPHLPLLIPPLTMFTMFAMFASTRCRARHFFGTSWQGLRYLRSASRYLLTYKALISHI